MLRCTCCLRCASCPSPGVAGIEAAKQRHAEILSHLLITAAKIAKDAGLEKGYRLVINNGPEGCQSVGHLHIHIIGGKQLTWPPGTGIAEGSMTG